MRILISCLILVWLSGCGPSLFDQYQVEVCNDDQTLMHAAAVDLDGSGVDHLAVSCAGTDNGALYIYRLALDGSAERVQQLDFDSRVMSSVAYDPDDTRAADLLVALSGPRERRIVHLTNVGSGQLADPEVIHATGGEVSRMAIADVDGDGIPDIVMPQIDTWLKNTGTAENPGPFNTRSIDPDAELRRFFGSLTDVSGDGRPGAAYIFQRQGSIRTYSRQGIGEFIVGEDINKVYSVKAGGDFNDDGVPDLVVTSQNSPTEYETRLLLSESVETWRLTDHLPDLGNPEDILARDFTGNSRIDLLAAPMAQAGQDNYTLKLLPGQDDATFGSPRTIKVSGFPYRMISAAIAPEAKAIIFLDAENQALTVLH